MSPNQKIIHIPPHHQHQRLDQALAQLLPEYSRAKLQAAIKKGEVLLDGKTVSTRYQVKGGECITYTLAAATMTEAAAEAIDLDIIYEDNEMIIINKPAGLTVHPGAGQASGTLLNALLFHAPSLKQLPRAGIVHRLDKDTTGLMVVAKTLPAQNSLVRQLQARTVKREYLALVYGEMLAGQSIDYKIGRDPKHRTRMKAFSEDFASAKEALTHVTVLKKMAGFTLVKASLATGRTHQIRVHLAKIGYPIVGDRVYGRVKIPKGASDMLIEALRDFKRQALHAEKLTLTHPLTHEIMSWQVPMPSDMETLYEVIAV